LSEESGKTEEGIVETGRLQTLKKLMRRVKGFLSQRYVWLSLTFGFLWMLSVPIIATILQGVLGDSIQDFTWIFGLVFFPFTLSSMIITDVFVSSDWVIIYGFSFVISMLFCLCIAYVIHEVRIHGKNHAK